MWAPDGPTWWPPAIGNPNIISPISRGYLSATYNPGYLWVVKNSIPLNKRHHFYLGPCNALKARLGVRFWKFTAANSYTVKVKTSGPKKSQTWCLVQPWSMGVTHFKYIIICIYISKYSGLGCFSYSFQRGNKVLWWNKCTLDMETKYCANNALFAMQCKYVHDLAHS